MTFAEKVKLVKTTYPAFENELIENMQLVNRIRNCLMHNNGFADERLEPNYSNGVKIVLSSGEIHGYGLMARRFGDMIWIKVSE